MSNAGGLGDLLRASYRACDSERVRRQACVSGFRHLWAPGMRLTALPAPGGCGASPLGGLRGPVHLVPRGDRQRWTAGGSGSVPSALCPSAPWHMPFWIILVRYLCLQGTHVLKTKSVSLQYLSRGCCLQAGGKHADRAPFPSTHLAERLGCLAGTLGLNFSVLFLLIVIVLSRFSPV